MGVNGGAAEKRSPQGLETAIKRYGQPAPSVISDRSHLTALNRHPLRQEASMLTF
jgi:hypothetical protein